MCAYAGRSSAASFDGTNYFAVWEDYRNSSGSFIYGSRIDTLGTILDPDGIPLIDGKNPAVVFDGTNYFAVCSGVKGVRIDTTAAIIDTIDVFLNGGDCPAILFDGTNYFAVWEYSNNIYGARIDTSGVVLDSNAIVISNGPFYEIGPAVAFDGTNYFVVWHYGTFVTTFDIHGARVDTMGNVIDTISILIATGAHRQCFPTVSFDGLNYFVAWEDRRNGYSDLYGTRVTQNGIVLDSAGIPLCVASSGQYLPEIKFDGLNYCMVWEDWRNSDYTDIYGCDVSPSGTVISEYVVSNQPKHQLQPVLAEGLNKFLITYTGFVDSVGSRAANTRRIWGKFQRFTSINEKSNCEKLLGTCNLEIYPNPSRQNINIHYTLPQPTKVNLSIYDVAGRLVNTLTNSQHEPGAYQKTFNTGDLSQGVYFVRLHTNEKSIVEKVIFLK